MWPGCWGWVLNCRWVGVLLRVFLMGIWLVALPVVLICLVDLIMVGDMWVEFGLGIDFFCFVCLVCCLCLGCFLWFWWLYALMLITL